MTHWKKNYVAVATVLAGCMAQVGGVDISKSRECAAGDGECTRALGNNSVLVEKMDPNGTVRGAWMSGSPHGFTVDVNRGAKLRIRFRAYHENESALDVRSYLVTPSVEYRWETDGYEGLGRPTGREPLLPRDASPGPFGDSAVVVDDFGWVTLPEFEVADGGEHRFVLSPNVVPGAVDPASGVGVGSYEIETACIGTPIQCNRPRTIEERGCDDRTLYLRGGQDFRGDQLWKACNVVLLENTVVAEGGVLTIHPGVHVKGNYLGEGQYGNVGLTVRGTLHAVGEENADIVFEQRLEDRGWFGLRLEGPDNRLHRVMVLKAQTAITVTSHQGNYFDHVIVDSCENGIRLEGGMATMENVNLFGLNYLDSGAQRHGIGIDARNGYADINGNQLNDREETDAVQRIEGTCTTAGEWCGSRSLFRRALVRGYETGINTFDTEIRLVDSVIAKNNAGVTVSGPDAGLHPAHTCPELQSGPIQRPAPRPPIRRWDPEFIHCDIVGNDTHGIRIDAPQILRVEYSNLMGNGGPALILATDSIGPDSWVKDSNVFNNNGSGAQVIAQQSTGVLSLRDNYWAADADPGLRNVFADQNTLAVTCRQNRPSWCGSRRTSCGAYRCTGNVCTASTTATWESPVIREGFWPVRLENTGPRSLEAPVDGAAEAVKAEISG